MNFLQLQVYNGKIALESVQMAHGHNVCKRAGFVAKVKEHANPERVTFTHDMIYREALAAKQFSLDLDIVLLDVINIRNCVKTKLSTVVCLQIFAKNKIQIIQAY